MDLAHAEPPTPSRRVLESRDDLASTLGRHWKVAVLIVVAVTALAWLVISLQPKRYRATAIAAVVPLVGTLTPQDIIRGVDALERRVVVSSLAAIAGMPATRRRVRASADYTIEAMVLPNTNLFRIEVEGPDPRRAAAIANDVPPIIAGHARAMYRLYDVTLVSEAARPSKPATPRLVRSLAAGVALGAFLGVVAAWLLDRRRSGAR